MRIGYTNIPAGKAVHLYRTRNQNRNVTKTKYADRNRLFEAVDNGEVQMAVIEAEDSVHGRIEENFDELYRRRFYVNAEIEIGTTRYFGVSSEPAVPRKIKRRKYKILTAITPHNDRPGLLRDISSVMGIYRVNMTDIFSRPAAEVFLRNRDAKMFYIIMEGHIMDDIFQTHILEGIKSILQHTETHPSFRFLGCYETAESAGGASGITA